MDDISTHYNYFCFSNFHFYSQHHWVWVNKAFGAQIRIFFSHDERNLIFIKFVMYPVSVWSAIIAPSFMLSVLTAVIGNEFKACNSDLGNSMTKKGNKLSKEDLSKMADKFCDLAGMVKRVDAMFSYTVALDLAASLGSLCVAVYYIVQGENVSAWTMSLSLALTVMILIPPLTSLNTKVSTALADPGGGTGMRASFTKI